MPNYQGVWSLSEQFQNASGWPFLPLPAIALFAGGGSGGYSNVIQYLAFSSLGNALDFGDLTGARGAAGACGSGTRSLVAGGDDNGSAPYLQSIDYFETTSTGNASDFGDLTHIAYGTAGASNSTRGLFYGGYVSAGPTNQIDYVTIATTGNALDFGDMGIDL